MRSLILLGVLAGCMSAILESPYVLSTGLGDVHSVAPTGANTMLVATSKGAYEIDGKGAAQTLTTTPATAVTAHPTVRYVVDAKGILALDGEARLEREGIADAQAWCDESVLFTAESAIWQWDPATGQTRIWAEGFSDLSALSLATEAKCESVLALDGDRALRVWAAQREVLASDLADAKALATDGLGVLHALSGTPPTLLRYVDETWQPIARKLDGATDLHFGFGGSFPRENLYLTGKGSLDYLRPPPISTPD